LKKRVPALPLLATTFICTALSKLAEDTISRPLSSYTVAIKYLMHSTTCRPFGLFRRSSQAEHLRPCFCPIATSGLPVGIQTSTQPGLGARLPQPGPPPPALIRPAQRQRAQPLQGPSPAPAAAMPFPVPALVRGSIMPQVTRPYLSGDLSRATVSESDGALWSTAGRHLLRASRCSFRWGSK
jgi:hypothetical protein